MMGQHMNGLQPHIATSPPDEPTVVQLNLGIKARHIMWAATIVGGMISSGTFAGYLFMPAKDRDLKALETQVRDITTKVVTLEQVALRLTDAVESLGRNVQLLVERPANPRPILPRERTQPLPGRRP